MPTGCAIPNANGTSNNAKTASSAKPVRGVGRGKLLSCIKLSASINMYFTHL